VKAILDQCAGEILKNAGVVGYQEFLGYMSSKGIRDRIRPSEAEQQYAQPVRGLRGQLTGLLGGMIRLGSSFNPAGAENARIQELREQLDNVQVQVRLNLANAIEAYILQLSGQLERIKIDAGNVLEVLNRGVETSRQRFNGTFGDIPDDSIKTLYEHETSAVGVNEIADFVRIIIDRVIDKTTDTHLNSMSDEIIYALNDMLLNVDTSEIYQRLTNKLEYYRVMVMAEFDIRYMSVIQDSDPRPPNHRLSQMIRRAAPAINVDGDIAEHSEMDLENTQLYSNPSGGDTVVERVFHDEMRRHPFKPVATPYMDRLDVIHITHGLPVTQLVGLDDLRNQYFHPDFDPRLLHLDPRWYFDTNHLTSAERNLMRQRGLSRNPDWAPSPWTPPVTTSTPTPAPVVAISTPAPATPATPATPASSAPVPPAADADNGSSAQRPADSSDTNSSPYGTGI
jgi:hypothetical protein